MEAIKMDELFDDELCEMVNFEDETTNPIKPVDEDKEFSEETFCNERKNYRRSNRNPVNAEWQPVKVWYDIKVFNCVKWFLLFAGLEYLVFYWMQTGQMQQSAAMPSMIVCAFLAGLSIRMNWKRGKAA